MGIEINTLYRFEGFEIDPSNRVFALAGKPIAIPSRAFDLLLYMARNTQRLLTKEELMKAIWGDSIVEESNLTQSVFLLRKALSAGPPAEKLIVTVPGRGYRFAAQIECLAMPPPVPATPETVAQPQAPGKPHRSDRWHSRWFIMGVVVGASAIAGMIVFLGGNGRPRNKPIPLPHRVTSNAPENPVATFAISPNGK